MNPVYRSLFWKRTLASLISLDQWRKQKNIRVSACVCCIRLNEKSCNPRAVLKIKDVLEFDGLRDLCGKGSPQGSFVGKTQTSRRNSVFEYLEIRRGTVPSSGFNFTRSRRNGHQKGIGIVKRYVIHHLIASRGVTERMNYFYYSFFGPPFDSCVSVFYYYYFFFRSVISCEQQRLLLRACEYPLSKEERWKADPQNYCHRAPAVRGHQPVFGKR